MIAIIKYNAGNVASVFNTIQKLGYEVIISDDPEIIKNADKVIFPGVGNAKSAMNFLIENNLDSLIKSLKQPVLGICLGLQLMCNHSEEGNVNCLGIFNVNVKRFPNKDIVPHTGWNDFSQIKSNLFKDVSMQENVYYVHSYYAEINESSIATCDYILPFSCALNKDNFYAVQFHPEKSSEVGTKILSNFLKL